jgi:hypothetical protein
MKHLKVWLKSIGLERLKVTMYMWLAELCMKENSFQFEGKSYEQILATSMGNALSLLVANLFMRVFELKRRKLFPTLWMRYVDDVFAIVLKDKIEDLMSLLHAQYPSIKFTCEIEKEGVLPFSTWKFGESRTANCSSKCSVSQPTHRGLLSTSHTTRVNKFLMNADEGEVNSWLLGLV